MKKVLKTYKNSEKSRDDIEFQPIKLQDDPCTDISIYTVPPFKMHVLKFQRVYKICINAKWTTNFQNILKNKILVDKLKTKSQDS